MKHLPQRKQIRLKNYDYSQSGYYFITLCTKDQKHSLGQIQEGVMALNPYGQIVDRCISKIEDIYASVKLDCKVVMPNHVHFIISTVGIPNLANLNFKEVSFQERSKMLIPKILQQFKTATIKLTKELGRQHGMLPLQWQRGYYDHIIRSEASYQQIYAYIETNPLKWTLDKYYSDSG
ncbi:MAG: transposase [Thermotaleaceae bacterium]